MVYADEADVLNVALFGCTAVEWRKRYPRAPGNMRDHANIYQLIVLSNLESCNAEMVKRGLDQRCRLEALNRAAREQLSLLLRSGAAEGLESGRMGSEHGLPPVS